MGLSDRDYAREPSSGLTLRAPQTAVGLLLAVNFGMYLVDLLLDGKVSRQLELSADLFHHPLHCWQLITYGFVHDPHDVWHILGNMFVLWMFGSDVERLYGRNEFLRIYFVALVVSGLAWVASQTWLMQSPSSAVLGASGAVTCIWVLFALHFPTRMILFLGFLPVPMWLLGFFSLSKDFVGFLGALSGRPGANVAFEAHLGGAVLALAYQRLGWNFGRWLPRSVTMTAPRMRTLNRPKLKLHEPTAEQPPSLDVELDRILEKISTEGTDSLTPEERRTLERASARYQKRRS